MSPLKEQVIAKQDAEPLRVGDRLWRPLHAKLWWTAVPLYWVGMWAGRYSQVVEDLYSSALAGCLTIFFFPPVVALILCFGFFSERLAASRPFEATGDLSEDRFPDPDSYGPSGMPWEFDPLDPRSGALWNGSPLHPINPAFINRGS